MYELTSVDYGCLGMYLAGILVLGVWVGRRIHTGTDYFLAGRRLPWWAVGMSLVATDIGGTDIIGVGGAAYEYGLAVGNFEWIGCVPAMIVAAFIFIPFFWRMGVFTIPELLERRFSASVRSAVAVGWLFFMGCNLGVMLMASAKMLAGFLGLTMGQCIIGTAVLVGIYTIAGGLAAVVYTDVVQCVVMILGCLLIVVIGLHQAGGVRPLKDQVRAAAEARRTAQQADAPEGEHTRLVLPVDTKSPFPWTGILFGLAMILSPAYWIGNQAIVQRSLGARSEFEAKAAYIWGALLKTFIPLLIAIPGLIALARVPHLEQGDQAFPTLVSQLLPTGLRGIFLAAFLAALMSSVDSYLNAASTIMSRDLYQRFVSHDVDDRKLLIVGRIATAALLLWGVVFAFWALSLQQGIYSIFQTLMAFLQGPTLAVLMAGLLWRRATSKGALAGFLGGVLTAGVLYSLSREDVIGYLGWAPLFQIREPFLYFSIWAFLAALALIISVSLLTTRESEEKTRYVVYSMMRNET